MPNVPRSPRQRRVAFVLEQHLGHKTYADNLVAQLEEQDLFDSTVVPVSYAPSGDWRERLPMPDGVRALLRGRREVARGIQPNTCDVHFFNSQVPAAIGGRGARAVPYVVSSSETPLQYDSMAAHYDHALDGPLVTRLKHRWNASMYRNAAAVVCWSSWARESVISDYGVPPERVVVIPPGVDLTRWAPRTTRLDGPVRIVFVGGDFVRKGGPELLQAFRSLDDNSAELTIVTKDPIGDAHDARVVVGLTPNDRRLIDLVVEADLFLLPTRAETFGVAAVEAQAAGVPVIATDLAGLRDVVEDGRTGYLVPVSDQDALDGAVRRLVQDGPGRRAMGEAARKRASKLFDQRTNAQRLFELLDCVIERQRRGGASDTIQV
jgi:glycosyltransferase involved in cell wall biosynthesis